MTKKKSLLELVALMNQFDDGAENLEMELEEVIELTKDKIDGYKDLLDQLESRSKILKKRSSEIQKQAEVLNNTRKRLRYHIKRNFMLNQIDKMPGNDYIASIVKKDNWKPVRAAAIHDFINHPQYVKTNFHWKEQPTLEIYNQLDELGLSDLINTSYVWDEKAIKQDLKSKSPNEFACIISEFEDASYVKFAVRKGIDGK